MLDWKKREGSARESVKETRTEPRGYFKSILLSRSIATLVGDPLGKVVFQAFATGVF